MKVLLDIFYALKRNNNSNSNRFAVFPFPGSKAHRVGISEEGRPIFFIKCKEGTSPAKTIDSKLKLIQVQYSKECELYHAGNETIKGTYTILALSSDSPELQAYFLQIVQLLINALRDTPSVSEVKTEADKIIDLFSKLQKPATKTIQGLWAELLAIESSGNPDYLIGSWHQSPSDIFDFNDGKSKIEVKSTSKSRRIHRFALEQLAPNKNSSLIIVSISTIETGKGKTAHDLMQSIQKRTTIENTIKLNEIVAETLGKDFEKIFSTSFDYQYGTDSIAFFDAVDIPSIEVDKREISNVKFDCDLTGIPCTDESRHDSDLHQALFN